MTTLQEGMPRVTSRVIPVDPFDLVIFGGTGDLARRKILPGLFRRYCAGQMPADARIIGAARTELDHAGYREMVADAIAEFGGHRYGNWASTFLFKVDLSPAGERENSPPSLRARACPTCLSVYFGLFGQQT